MNNEFCRGLGLLISFNYLKINFLCCIKFSQFVQIDRLLDKFFSCHKVKKLQTHCTEARQAVIGLIKKKRTGKKLIDKTKPILIRCLQADFQLFLDFPGKQSSTLLA